MVRTPQSHRRKVLLPDGAQNFSTAGAGSSLFTLSPEGVPARIKFGLYFYAPPPARLVCEARPQQYWLPGYWPSSSRASLPVPYPAVTLHA